jgi:hypothetical protein
VALSDDFKTLELLSGTDYDGTGTLGTFSSTPQNNNQSKETSDIAYVINFKGDDFLKTGISFHAQYFNISADFVAPGAARGDTALGAGGFGASSTALTADVLAMIGNQSAHRAPQAVDFVADVPLPSLPSDFMLPDPFYGTAGVTWINDNWEGVAAAGWKGFTFILRKAASLWRVHAELSLINFNESTLSDYSMMRAYAAFDYSLVKIGRGLKLTASAMYQSLNKPSGMDDASYLSPKLNLDLQITKSFNAAVGFRYELCKLDDAAESEFKRLRINIEFNMNIPLGFIKMKGEIYSEDPGTFTRSNNKTGAFAITEWEYAF